MKNLAICRKESLFLGSVQKGITIVGDDILFSPSVRRGKAKCPTCKRWLGVVVREFDEDIYELYLPPHRKGEPAK